LRVVSLSGGGGGGGGVGRWDVFGFDKQAAAGVVEERDECVASPHCGPRSPSANETLGDLGRPKETHSAGRGSHSTQHACDSLPPGGSSVESSLLDPREGKVKSGQAVEAAAPPLVQTAGVAPHQAHRR
jgi:hypothetical protein